MDKLQIVWYYRDSEGVGHKLTPYSPTFQPFIIIFGETQIRAHTCIITSNLTLNGLDALKFSALNSGSYFCRPEASENMVFSASNSLSVFHLIQNLENCKGLFVRKQSDWSCAGNIDSAVAKLQNRFDNSAQTVDAHMSVQATTVSTLNGTSLESTTDAWNQSPQPSNFEIAEPLEYVAPKIQPNIKPWLFLLGTVGALAVVLVTIAVVVAVVVYKNKKFRKLQT